MKPGFLTDCNGKPSSTRLLVLLTVPALVLVPLAVWMGLSIAHGVMQPIEPTVPLYLATANGIILGYSGYKSSNEPVAPPPLATHPSP